MRRTAVLIVAALVLAGCGAKTTRHATAQHVSTLCVGIGVPLSGPHAQVGRQVLAGVRQQIPAAGLSIGGYHLRMCPPRGRGAAVGSSAQAVLATASRAAGSAETIAFIGELSSADAATAEAALAPAGVPFLALSGPIPATTDSLSLTSTTDGETSTALFLLPSAASQSEAVTDAVSYEHCVVRKRADRSCSMVGPTSAPLCSALPASTSPARRFCVGAGPDLSRWTSPAVAYGNAAAAVLIADLRAVTAAGRDVADRTTVMNTLKRVHVTSSAIGDVHFDSAGTTGSRTFTIYTVESSGGLVPSKTFTTH